MKRILFVGDCNLLFDDNCFDNLFDVQVCAYNVNSVNDNLKLKQPDIAVISIISRDNDLKEILHDFKLNYPKIPVLCVGTELEVDIYEKELDPHQFTLLTLPIKDEAFIETVCKTLNLTYKDNQIIDNNHKKCVLVVDDSGIQLRVMNTMLKSKYEVKLATSGMQAITSIGNKKPDIIILDYEMPVCDGKMTLQMIRELEGGKDIPVVFLTGVSDNEHISSILELKPAGYILKPANAEIIYETLDKILGN